jgi:hypothetical protein
MGIARQTKPPHYNERFAVADDRMTPERFEELSILSARRGVLTFSEVCEILNELLKARPELSGSMSVPKRPKPAA